MLVCAHKLGTLRSVFVAIVILAVFAVAYANGANANFKGVASLYGSGTTSFRTAVYWGTATTAAGALIALFSASKLLKAFSGKGLVPDTLIADPAFFCAVAIGAAATGGLATWLGFPVSTTHALTGALVGAGLTAAPGGVNFVHLWNMFAKPLLYGPAVAIVVGMLVYAIMRGLKVPEKRSRTLDALHFLSAGAVCAARGMNDTPKMAALLFGISALGGVRAFILVAVAMVIGGLISARKVAETLAHKITDMNPAQGFAANLTTSILVILGTIWGLPLSTTHVTVGSLLGIGITTRQARWKTAIPVLLALLITVPCGALLASLSYLACRLLA